MLSLSKTISFLILGALLLSCGNGNKKDPNRIYFDSAAEYHAFINSHFERVNLLWNSTLAEMDDSVLAYKQLDLLTMASDSACSQTQKLADFKGDSIYRLAAANYFCYMSRIAHEEFKEAINIGIQDSLTDSLYFRFDQIGNQIGADKDTCIARLKAAQAKFIQLINK